MSLATQAKDNIKTPKDLEGRTVAGCPGWAQAPMIYALLEKKRSTSPR